MLRSRLSRSSDRPDALAAALADLQRLAARRPELAEPARTLAQVLDAAFGVPDGPEPAPPPELAAIESSGAPLCDGLRIAADPAILGWRGLRILRISSLKRPAARELRRLLAKDGGRVERWGRSILAGQSEAAEADWKALGVDPELAATVVRLAWLPTLAAMTHAPSLSARFQGHAGAGCPFCGSPASLAESRGLESRRALRCGRCAADWPGPRLGCPACGESGAGAIDVRWFEGEADRCRLATCRSCGFRLKVLSTLALLSAPGILVAELSTVHLDALAAAQGTG